MKEKQGNKPNSYGKLMKRMLIYLGIGGVCGFFVGIFMMFGLKNIFYFYFTDFCKF